MRRAFLMATCALLLSPIAAAEDSCGCEDEQWTDGCTASVRLDGRWLFVTSSVRSCSRVEWLASDKPQVTLVSGGENIREWTGQPEQPTLAVQSCQVCKADRDRDRGREQDDDDDSSSSADKENEDGAKTKKSGGLSPFQGTWFTEREDVFGAPIPYELKLEVNGKEITGTISAGFFDGERGKAAVFGTVQTLSTAVITINARGWGRTRLKLLDRRTLELDSGLSNVTLEKR